jgi:hypothetical protein
MINDTLLSGTVPNGSTTPIVGHWLVMTPVPTGSRIRRPALQLVTDGTLHGSWKVEASNKLTPDDDDDPVDVTAIYGGGGSSSIAAVTGPSSQMVQDAEPGSLWAHAIRVSFVPSSGAGNVIASTEYPSGSERQAAGVNGWPWARRKTILDVVVGDTSPQTSAWFPIVDGGVSLQLATQGTVAGTWKVLGSNARDVDIEGDPSATDITAAFKTATGDAIQDPAGSALSQLVQGGAVFFKAVAVVFTPSSGAGPVRVHAHDAIP